jgi:hypothetical protein
MAGLAKLFWFNLGIDEGTNGLEAIVSRDPGGATVADKVDRDRKGSFKGSCVDANHQMQAQLLASVLDKRSADQTPPVCCHEVYDLRRNAFGRADEVTFILTVFVIHYNNDFSVLDFFDSLFDRV